jgi:Protein of unknown function (DUF938)
MITHDKSARQHSGPAERNRVPILEQLQRLLPTVPAPQGRERLLLEIASGTGQHAAHCSVSLAHWLWQPTDFEAESLPSIQSWCEGLERVRPPLQLDVMAKPWPGVPTQVDAMFCANMIHIAPWACCAALMQGAARHLALQGLLITYGPYLEDEVQTSPGNLSFDVSLRQRNPAWGIRRREDVEAQAQQAGLVLRERVEMPANNLLLVWGRAPLTRTDNSTP